MLAVLWYIVEGSLKLRKELATLGNIFTIHISLLKLPRHIILPSTIFELLEMLINSINSLWHDPCRLAKSVDTKVGINSEYEIESVIKSVLTKGMVK
jgi:hypothetical protein